MFIHRERRWLPGRAGGEPLRQQRGCRACLCHHRALQAPTRPRLLLIDRGQAARTVCALPQGVVIHEGGDGCFSWQQDAWIPINEMEGNDEATIIDENMEIISCHGHVIYYWLSCDMSNVFVTWLLRGHRCHGDSAAAVINPLKVMELNSGNPVVMQFIFSRYRFLASTKYTKKGWGCQSEIQTAMCFFRVWIFIYLFFFSTPETMSILSLYVQIKSTCYPLKNPECKVVFQYVLLSDILLITLHFALKSGIDNYLLKFLQYSCITYSWISGL